MINQRQSHESNPPNTETKLAKVLQYISGSDNSEKSEGEVIQYIYDIAAHYKIDLEAAQQIITSRREQHDLDDMQVMQYFQITEEELAWTASDTAKLGNQHRKLKDQPPLEMDRSMGKADCSHLYPSSRDWARWELMRNRKINTSYSDEVNGEKN